MNDVGVYGVVIVDLRGWYQILSSVVEVLGTCDQEKRYNPNNPIQ